LPVLQSAPCVQGIHVPDPLHTPPGQVVPAAKFPVVMQTALPELQS
jgi:hypothetical protein